MHETKPWDPILILRMIDRKEAFDRTRAEIHALPVTTNCPLEELV